MKENHSLEELQEGSAVALPTLTTLELTSWSLRESSIPMNLWDGYTPLNEYLSTKMYLKIKSEACSPKVTKICIFIVDQSLQQKN